EDPNKSQVEDPNKSQVEDPNKSQVEDPNKSQVEDPNKSQVEDPNKSQVEDPNKSQVEDPNKSQVENFVTRISISDQDAIIITDFFKRIKELDEHKSIYPRKSELSALKKWLGVKNQIVGS
ncbi:MAG: hypothetical protein EAX89_16900, partial [Candidatus Lokiarchaeota archaeon]|nr:hypothetical protein [Candidatus Lokiarchaeota archaeon]